MTSDDAGEAPIDEMLDRAIQAVNHGDEASARVFAQEVLAVDSGNAEAEDLLAAPVGGGEIRRLTIMFADLVDSTALSARVEAEIYRTVVGRYKELVRQIVERYEGHIASTKGDGLLAVFGHPRAHEDDARRAVQAGLDITREVTRLSEQAQRRFGFEVQVRVGVHRGLVFLDVAQDDVYGLAANLTARVSSLAPPDSVVVSNAIARLIGGHFQLEVLPAQTVKGIDEPVEHHRVVGERLGTARTPLGPLVGASAKWRICRPAGVRPRLARCEPQELRSSVSPGSARADWRSPRPISPNDPPGWSWRSTARHSTPAPVCIRCVDFSNAVVA